MGESLVSKALGLEARIGEYANAARRMIAINEAIEAYISVLNMAGEDEETRDWARQKLNILGKWLSADYGFINAELKPSYFVSGGQRTLLTVENLDKFVESLSIIARNPGAMLRTLQDSQKATERYLRHNRRMIKRGSMAAIDEAIEMVEDAIRFSEPLTEYGSGQTYQLAQGIADSLQSRLDYLRLLKETVTDTNQRKL